MQLLRTTNQDPRFTALTRQLDADLQERYGQQQEAYAAYNRLALLETAVIGMVDGQAVACGCFKPLDTHSAEIKRMYVRPEWRRRGFSEQLLVALELWARELGLTHLVLETGKGQPEALALYYKRGFVVTANYDPYIDLDNSICLAKSL